MARSSGGFTIELKDAKKFTRDLKKLSDSAVRAEQLAIRELNRSGPPAIADAVNAHYNIPKNKVNANSKAKNGWQKGKTRASMGGTTVDTWSITYKGPRLTVDRGMFGNTGTATAGRKHEVNLEITRGRKKPRFGHWQKPWSEGGKYGKTSPWFKGPGSWQGTVVHRDSTRMLKNKTSRILFPLYTLSIPQMVANEEVEAQYMEALQKLAFKKLEEMLGRAEKRGWI